jgi:Holliday junction resolvasome RuvABC endonuclease subunit
MSERVAVAGIDPSLNAPGLCAISADGKIHTKTLGYKPVRSEMTVTKSGKSKAMTTLQEIDRLIQHRDAIREFMLEHHVKGVGIEGYAFSKRSSSVTGLAELGGVIRSMLVEDLGLIPMILTVSSCRKFVVGSGKATKDQTNAWLRSQDIHPFANDDEGDAYVVALPTYYVVNRTARSALDLKRCEFLDDIIREAKRKSPAGPRCERGSNNGGGAE